MRIITAAEEITVLNRADLEAEVFDLVAVGETVAIDFSNTGYIDSSGFGMLLALQKRLKEAGGELLLLELAPSIMELMRKSCLLQLFAVGSAPQEDSMSHATTS